MNNFYMLQIDSWKSDFPCGKLFLDSVRSGENQKHFFDLHCDLVTYQLCGFDKLLIHQGLSFLNYKMGVVIIATSLLIFSM